MPTTDPPTGKKWCPKCEKSLPIVDFGANRSTADGRSAYCRPCHNAAQREWKHNHITKVRKWKRRYDANQRLKKSGVSPKPQHLPVLEHLLDE